MTEIDPVVVDRLVAGIPVKASQEEKQAAIELLLKSNDLPRWQIAEQVGCHLRTVDNRALALGLTQERSPNQRELRRLGVVEAMRQGLRVGQMAHRFGVTPKTIYDDLRALNLPRQYRGGSSSARPQAVSSQSQPDPLP